MARNKMEKEFGEKLNQREIKPTAAAWDRLDAMLAATEAQPKVIAVKRSYKWLYVAASLLGFLFIGTLFFSQRTTNKPEQNNMIPTETAQEPNAQSPLDSITTSTPKEQIASSNTDEIKSEKPSVKKLKTVIRNSENQPQVAQNIINQNQLQSGESINNQKTQSLQTATGPNADELLAAAQSKREINSSGTKVNARKLLLEVDNQAEEKLSLRQKALRALNKNYQQVKVAVENRNLDENH